ncbi:MAG: ATP-dependent DNA ligase [Candidatus Obscuribacterales bacterium]|nr:ATP-dependent DNA ligase [Candidatus Obscuribacterales bacterium]
MKRFAALFLALDETNKTGEKTLLMSEYFKAIEPADAAWAVYFLTGRKLRQLVPRARLSEWALELAGISPWMFQECYDTVGDLAETLALLLPPNTETLGGSLAEWVEQRLLPLRTKSESDQKRGLIACWMGLSDQERFVVNKIITGGLRLGVSQQLVVKALSEVSGLTEADITHRLMGEWEPTESFYLSLINEDTQDTMASKPYPFFLSYPLEAHPESLGDINEWYSEWKWDGIRAQVIRREDQTFIWSRGEELVTDRFPEISAAALLLPNGTVLDGEILAWRDSEVLPFQDLQKRIGRKVVGKKVLSDAPVIVMCFDLLELDGVDLRQAPLEERRSKLLQLLTPGALDEHASCRAQLSPVLRVSPLAQSESWELLEQMRSQSRLLKVEGLMLKRASSKYGVGRRKGDWWKWKIEPYSVDAVLIYAQKGSGKRASLYTDYTFGVWMGEQLVPVAKAYSGLTDDEIKQVDAFIRQNTLEKFGPVRTVKPGLVFEIAFEGIQPSPRHKSGVAVRFPRILRWRTDKNIQDADTLDNLKKLLG